MKKPTRLYSIDVERFLGSARYSQMSFAEKGKYHQLLFKAWQRNDCLLPSDPRILARIIGTNSIPKIVLDCFEKVIVDDVEFLRNPAQWESFQAEEKRSQLARNKARQRWGAKDAQKLKEAWSGIASTPTHTSPTTPSQTHAATMPQHGTTQVDGPDPEENSPERLVQKLLLFAGRQNPPLNPPSPKQRRQMMQLVIDWGPDKFKRASQAFMDDKPWNRFRTETHSPWLLFIEGFPTYLGMANKKLEHEEEIQRMNARLEAERVARLAREAEPGPEAFLQ